MDDSAVKATRTNHPVEMTDPIAQEQFDNELLSRFAHRLEAGHGYIDLEDIRDFLSPEDQEIFDNSDLPFAGQSTTLDYAPNFDRIADMITQGEETARFLTEKSIDLIHKLLETDRFATQIDIVDKADRGADDNRITLAQLIHDMTAAVTDAHSNITSIALDEDDDEEITHEWEGEDDAINFLIGNDFKVDRNAKTVMLPEGDDDDILSLEIDALEYLKAGGFRVFDWNGKDLDTKIETAYDSAQEAVAFLTERGYVFDEIVIDWPVDKGDEGADTDEDIAIQYLLEVHDYEFVGDGYGKYGDTLIPAG